MQESYRYFLIVAEELNITHAAKRLFISQQSLSIHIKKLEEKYSTQLFYRHPRLTLTPAGEALAASLHQIQIIENSLDEQIRESGPLIHGSINIGINPNRASLLFSQIIPQFYNKYQNIKIKLIYGKTNDLEPLLITGKLDFFIGISFMQTNKLVYHILANETIYLVISDYLLKTLHISEEKTNEFINKGVNLDVFKTIPFVPNTKSETLRLIFDTLSMGFSNQLIIPFEIDDPLLRASLCSQNFCATLFTESMLPYLDQVTRSQDRANRIYALPVKHNHLFQYRSILAYPQGTYISKYRQYFMDLVFSYYHSSGAIITPNEK